MAKLAGKTALVTGASRGIGRASALALAREGAFVIVHYNNSRPEAEEVVQEIARLGSRAVAIGADLTTPDGAHRLAELVKPIVPEQLDIVVLNAGISKAATIEETTVEDFDRLFAVNVRAPFFLVQQLLPLLGAGSSITMLTSVAARSALGTIAAYASTKGAIATLIRHFAVALGPREIRVNGVAPGVIDTDMSSFTKTADGRDAALSMQALKRLGTADDVASAIALLAYDESRWITGAILEVSGGTKV